MVPKHRPFSAAAFLFAFLMGAVADGAAQAPPNPVLLDAGPVLEIEDEDVPIGACQVEVDCPDAITLGQEGLCRVHVLQKVADDAGQADFEERKVPPGIWRQVWPPEDSASRESAAQAKRRRAFAWKIDVSRVLRGWRCIQTRDEEPFTLGNRFRLRPDFCPAIVYVGAHPLRYFPLQPESGIPYACELREEPVEEPALVCNLLRDLEEPDGGTLPEELGCVGELLIKACQVRFDCPPPIVPPTPTPTTPFITPPTPPFVTPPTPTPSITPTPTPTATPTLTPSPTPTLPIYQEPGRVVPRSDGPHALEMHGRIQANPATFDPNSGGVTWQFWVGSQKLVDFTVPAGAFRAFAGGVYRYSGTGARVAGGIEYLNFHDISVGGTPGKAVSAKGYSDTLDALVELPGGVTSVEARFTLITSAGTFSSTGPMRRGPGGIWRMDFPSHGGIAPP